MSAIVNCKIEKTNNYKIEIKFQERKITKMLNNKDDAQELLLKLSEIIIMKQKNIETIYKMKNHFIYLNFF